MIWLGAAAALFTLIALDHHGLLLFRGDWMRYHGKTFSVVKVVDGDTLDIAAPHGEKPTTRVRLWGVDTPELARSTRPAEPLAHDAAALTRRLCEGQTVTLQLEPHRLRGRFDRLLAHVALPDETLLNEALLLAGLARVDERYNHSRLTAYQMLARQARYEGVGIYGLGERQ